MAWQFSLTRACIAMCCVFPLPPHWRRCFTSGGILLRPSRCCAGLLWRLGSPRRLRRSCGEAAIERTNRPLRLDNQSGLVKVMYMLCMMYICYVCICMMYICYDICSVHADVNRPSSSDSASACRILSAAKCLQTCLCSFQCCFWHSRR